MAVRETAAGGWHPGNLRACRNRLVCPWCSWSYRLVQARAWAAVLDAAIADGCEAWLLVLTVRHEAGESLGDVRSDLMAGWQRWRQRRQVRRVVMTWAWALDVVLGGPSGPHPHLNVLVLTRGVPEAAMRLAAGHWAGGKWPEHRRPSLRVGHSVELVDAADVAAVSGYAVRDVSGATFEALENRYRETRGDDGGMTLPALAVEAAGGNDDSGRLLRHAAAELVGVRSVGSSDSWREIEAALGVVDGEDVEAILDEAGDVRGWVEASGWRRHEMALREAPTVEALWARCVALGVRFSTA